MPIFPDYLHDLFKVQYDLLPIDARREYRHLVRQLVRMARACTHERDIVRNTDTNGYAYDLTTLFYMSYLACRPWHNLKIYVDADEQQKIVIDTEISHVTSLIRFVLRHPPKTAFDRLWRTVNESIDNADQTNLNRFGWDYINTLLQNALKVYSDKVIEEIDNCINNNPNGLNEGFRLMGGTELYFGWFSPHTSNVIPWDGLNSVQRKLFTQLSRDALNTTVHSNGFYNLFVTLFCGNVLTARMRRYSKYGIPIPVGFLPISRVFLESDFGPIGPRGYVDFVNGVTIHNDDFADAWQAQREKLKSDGFFAQFSDSEPVRPTGGTQGIEAENAHRVRPTGNNWRRNIAHIGIEDDSEDPHTSEDEDNADDRNNNDDNPDGNDANQPDVNAPQPNPVPGIPRMTIHEDDYVRGGTPSLLINSFRWINIQKTRTWQERDDCDHYIRFGDVGNVPQRVRRADVRSTDHKVFDGRSTLDNAYIITFSRSGQPIFNQIV